MSLIKFKVSWEDDDSIFRNIEVVSSQSFFEFHTCIKSSFQFPENLEGIFYLSNDNFAKGKAISSMVEKNLRDAPALSMKKSPVGALVTDPDQKLVYELQHPKHWNFLIEIITVSPFSSDLINYPRCIKTEGISPVNFGMTPMEKDGIVEIEEKYDLNQQDGFGDEGEDEVLPEDEQEGNEEASENFEI